ncbi:hypothetical protein [Bacillus nitratireducens]|uniref:hypothetical protein n=1 Tax=Bacillus nitratireducens TaxID=2026193 RepID=UPI002E78EE40|nr:hypothetical protein [Bacillus nitratireducens]
MEKNRDEETVRENALIVYYDIQRGISNLRDLYISCLLKNRPPKPNRIYFSADWIKNVANLRDALTSQELNRVYKLYEQFYALQNILEEYKVDKPNEELRRYLEELSKEVFADIIPSSLLIELKVSSVDDLVGIDLYIILQKINCLTFASSKEKPKEKVINGKPVYETYLNGALFFVGDTKEPFVGDGELYNTDGKIKCSGQFKSKQFVKGTVYGYYDSVKKCYEITCEALSIKKGILYKLTNDDSKQYFYNGEFKDGRVLNGITTLFHKNKKISYHGEIKDGFRDGQGTLFNEDGQKLFEGIWKEHVFYNGVGFEKDKELFKGEYKNRMPWNGIATACDLSFEVKNFTGEIREGKPVTGEGLLFKIDGYGQTLERMRREEEHQVEQIEASAQEEPDIEQYKQELENEAWLRNNGIRSGMRNYHEYIEAKWNEKNVTLAQDKEKNIVIYDEDGSRLT